VRVCVIECRRNDDDDTGVQCYMASFIQTLKLCELSPRCYYDELLNCDHINLELHDHYFFADFSNLDLIKGTKMRLLLVVLGNQLSRQFCIKFRVPVPPPVCVVVKLFICKLLLLVNKCTHQHFICFSLPLRL